MHAAGVLVMLALAYIAETIVQCWRNTETFVVPIFHADHMHTVARCSACNMKTHTWSIRLFVCLAVCLGIYLSICLCFLLTPVAETSAYVFSVSKVHHR